MSEDTEVSDAELFRRWMQTGLMNGFTSGMFCAAHDHAPLSVDEIEQAALDEIDSHDVCAMSVRVFPPQA